MRMLTLNDFINKKVVVLHEATRSKIAARAMCEHRIGCILVANHKSQIIGIVTDRDLTCELMANDITYETPVSEVMTPDPVTASEDSSLDDVIRLMKDNGVRRIPIIKKIKDGQQKCLGIVTLDDLVCAQFISNEDLSQIVSSQVIRKSKTSPRLALSESRPETIMELFTEDLVHNLMLDEPHAEQFAKFVLRCVIQRLHFTAALYLTSRLPKILEKELLPLATGPDTTITAFYITTGVESLLHINESDAKELLFTFWNLLERGIGAEHTYHILHQLPKDIRLLFSSRSQLTDETISASV